MKSKYLKFFGCLFAFIILVSLLWFLEINSPIYEIGIEGNAVHFKTPGFLVQIMCGKPDVKKEYSETSGAKEYIYYNQTLFGRQGNISYYCLFGVNHVYIEIPVEEQSGEEAFYYISSYMSEIYSQKPGYYDEGIIVDEEGGRLIHDMGADFGARGMMAGIEYADNQIRIIAYYQY